MENLKFQKLLKKKKGKENISCGHSKNGGCHRKKKRKKKKRHLGTVGSRSRVVARRSWPCLSRQRREPEINKREHGTWTAFSASPRARVAMASIQKYSAGGTLISTWRLRRREKTNRQEVNTFPPHDVCTHVSVCDARPGRDFQKIYSTAQRLRMNSCAREWSSRVIFRQTKFPT